MRFLASIILAGTVIFGAATNHTEAASPPASRPAADAATVKKLIAQLGADEWQQREASQDELLAMGDAVIEDVRLATKSDNLEIRERAEAILQKLTTPDPWKMPRFTLKFDDAPARDVYQSLFKQSNATLETWPTDLWDSGHLPKVTVNLQKVSFWDAFDALQEQTGLTLRAQGLQTVLQAAEARHPGLPGTKLGASRNGPFKVVAHSLSGRGLTVYVEPRLRVLAYSREADVEKLVEARPLPRGFRPPEMMQRDRLPLDERGGNVFDVALPNSVAARGIAYLKGSVRVRIARGEQTIEIDGVDQTNDGVLERVIKGQRVLMNLSSPEPGEFKVMLSVAYPDPPPGEPDKAGLWHAQPTLLDAAGHSLSTPGGSTHGLRERVDFTWEFHTTPGFEKPAKLVLSIPDEISETAIPFEFGRPPAGDADEH